jgi:hypothetical protein
VVRRVDQIHRCWREFRDGRVDISSLVCRWIMTGVWRRASHEDVLMVGDFLHDFQVAMAWIPSGAPEDVFDVVFQDRVPRVATLAKTSRRNLCAWR